MKALLLCLTSLLLVFPKINAQPPCFYNPNNGPIYSNGSSGAIYDVTSQDFNSDDHLDIVTANSIASNISFIPGYGNGTLGTADTISVSGVLFSITSGDYNGDNKYDVAVTNAFNILVLLGNGDGTFQPYSSYPLAGSTSRIYSEDINDDNILDLVGAGTNGVFVVIGQGDGTFLPFDQYLEGIECIDVTITDFDGDSILDLISTTRLSPTESELSFFKGIGNGTFANNTSLFSMFYPNSSIAGIVAVDANADGLMDLIVANSNISVSRVEVYFGNTDGTLSNPVFYPTTYSPFYLYLADFDNDLISDIVVEESNGFSVLIGNSNGNFQPAQYFSAAVAPNSLAIGDYNTDGIMDIIAPSSYFGSPLITIMLNCDVSTGMAKAQPNQKVPISISPNPFSTQTILYSNQLLKDATITIYSLTGQKVNQITNVSGHSAKLLLEKLPSGFYLLNLSDKNGIIAIKKILIVE